jgi:C4-dicarboxylate transporter, DctM subunit
MTPQIIGWIGLAVFIALMVLGIPIGGAMAIVGILGYWAIMGLHPTLNFLGMMSYEGISNYSMTVIPLFMIMGHFAFFSRFPADIFETARRWLGRIPGGMVQATVIAAGAFGAASGSMLATCSVLSKICVPEMLKQGVNKRLALGAVGSSSTIDGLIPPSIAMVVYGILTETSIGKLLIAGILPGILVIGLFMLMILVRVLINPSLAPRSTVRYTFREKVEVIPKQIPFLLVVVVVLGGLYIGVFTPTEAGGVGAVSTLLIGVFMRRLKMKDLKTCLLETVQTTIPIFFILIGAFLFSYFISVSRIPAEISEFLVALPISGMTKMILILILYLILGCIMDELAAMFITLPILFPVIKQAGIDPVYFGVLMCVVQAVGLLTPPYGVNIFIMRAVVPDTTTNEIVAGLGWFLLMNGIALVILIVFPQICLFLPNLMKG